MKIPHPFPYQGSKRNISPSILPHFPKDIDTLIEPFVGSGAITIASANKCLANSHYINDLNTELVNLWQAIINTPNELLDGYTKLWNDQQDDPKVFYKQIRESFNKKGRTDYFLYLLARCVKGAVRYNSKGELNQSPDNRRLGMRPNTMLKNILQISALLKNKTRFAAKDYTEVFNDATENDLIYMDPPYQGTSNGRDARYYESVSFDKFVVALEGLNERNIRYIISYDGRTGDKVHGKKLPDHLELKHLEIHAGLSSQATLQGKKKLTIESLYLSNNIVDATEIQEPPQQRNMTIMEAVV